jgi:glycosyltransferase involved in cell wall biosynthesis
MKIMLVLANGGPGGMQRQVALLANGLAAARHDVTVVVGGLEAVVGLNVSEVHLIRISEYRGKSGGWEFLRDLRRQVRDVRPHVLHGHGLRLALSLRLVKQRKTVTLVTSHGIDPEVVHGLQLPLKLARIRVVACGEAPKQLLSSIGISSTVVPVGIEEAPLPKSRAELCMRCGIPPNATIAVSAIRLSDQKDPATMVSAVAQVDGLHLVLFGDGPLLEALKMLALSHGVADRIHFAGYDREARGFLSAGDLVVLSSRWEGHVLVALEAMAAGVPLVATTCPGIGEWVTDEKTALLSPVGDVEALAANLRRITEEPHLAKQLVERGLNLAAHHGVSAMVAAHLAAYGISA